MKRRTDISSNKKILFIGISFFIVLLIGSFYTINVLDRNNNYKEGAVWIRDHVLKIGDMRINIDIADTPELHDRGLSGRTSLPEDRGMYFIFDRSDIYPFWMKEMNFPIDIIWIDERMSIVDITKDISPLSFPQNFASKVPVRHVLEVNAGFADRYGVKIGDQVSLEQHLE